MSKVAIVEVTKGRTAVTTDGEIELPAEVYSRDRGGVATFAPGTRYVVSIEMADALQRGGFGAVADPTPEEIAAIVEPTKDPKKPDDPGKPADELVVDRAAFAAELSAVKRTKIKQPAPGV